MGEPDRAAYESADRGVETAPHISNPMERAVAPDCGVNVSIGYAEYEDYNNNINNNMVYQHEDDDELYDGFQLAHRNLPREDPIEAMLKHHYDRKMAQMEDRFRDLYRDIDPNSAPNSMKPEVDSEKSSVASSGALNRPRTPNQVYDYKEMGAQFTVCDDYVAEDSDIDMEPADD
jgi:hypothetical protein